jgi:hypothetical protein
MSAPNPHGQDRSCGTSPPKPEPNVRSVTIAAGDLRATQLVRPRPSNNPIGRVARFELIDWGTLLQNLDLTYESRPTLRCRGVARGAGDRGPDR